MFRGDGVARCGRREDHANAMRCCSGGSCRLGWSVGMGGGGRDGGGQVLHGEMVFGPVRQIRGGPEPGGLCARAETGRDGESDPDVRGRDPGPRFGAGDRPGRGGHRGDRQQRPAHHGQRAADTGTADVRGPALHSEVPAADRAQVASPDPSDAGSSAAPARPAAEGPGIAANRVTMSLGMGLLGQASGDLRSVRGIFTRSSPNPSSTWTCRSSPTTRGCA